MLYCSLCRAAYVHLKFASKLWARPAPLPIAESSLCTLGVSDLEDRCPTCFSNRPAIKALYWSNTSDPGNQQQTRQPSRGQLVYT